MATEPFIGEIRMAGFNFAPRGYAFCNGQIMSIAQNTALFSLLGTTYGGNGQTTFALPNLQGRVPVHFGTGPGLPAVQLGEASGSVATTLTPANMPAHSHPLGGSVAMPAFNGAGGAENPNGTIPASSSPNENYAAASSANAALAPIPLPANTGVAGNGQSFSNMQPYLGLNFYIALQGIFPSRN
jgi:microcystin-dependent protein